jgi:hypothetical protein
MIAINYSYTLLPGRPKPVFPPAYLRGEYGYSKVATAHIGFDDCSDRYSTKELLISGSF